MTKSPLTAYDKQIGKHYGKRTHAVDRITPHCFVGQVTAERGIDVFLDPNKQASVNYVVAHDGRIACGVYEEYGAWTSSNKSNDMRAITIEVASDTSAPYAVKDAAFTSLKNLCIDICKRYAKKKLIWIADKTQALAYTPKADEMQLTVHQWFSNTACPGAYLLQRMGTLANEVTKALQPVAAPKPAGPSAWAKEDWEWAKSKGITDGSNPQATATREQVISMIRRAIE